MDARFVPSPRFLRRLHPRRGHPLATAGQGANRPLARWQPGAAALAAVKARWETGTVYWLRDPDVPAEVAHRPEVERTLAAARCLAAGELPEGLDADLLAAMETMAEAPLASAFAERYGIVTALDAKLRSLGLGAVSLQVQKRPVHLVGTRVGGGHVDPGNAHLAPLRALLCAASDADYAEARAFAAKARVDAPIAVRASIAFLFPEEPGWANDDLAQVLAALPPRTTLNTFAVLFGSVTDPKLLHAWIAKSHSWAAWYVERYVVDALLRHDPDAASEVVAHLTRRSLEKRRALPSELEALGIALGALRTAIVGDAFASVLLVPGYGRLARDWYRAYPELAPVTLRRTAEQKSALGDAARHVLASVERAAGFDEDALVADASALPAWLRDPPIPAAEPITLELPFPAPEGSYPWRDSEREKALAIRESTMIMSPEQRERWRALAVSARYVDVWMEWVNGKWVHWAVPDDEGLALWNADPHAPHRHPPLYMLALHGDVAFPGVLARNSFDELARVRSAAVAIVCARGLRSLTRRARARSWLAEHPGLATTGLLPHAFGPASRRRRDAEMALRFVARRDRAAVDAAARELGDAALRATTAYLDADRLVGPAGAREERLVGILPRLRFADGRALPHGAVARLLGGIKRCTPHVDDPRLRELVERLDPGSRDAFAVALLHEWALAGATTDSAWLAHAVAVLGTKATLRRTWPLLDHWSRRSGKRAAIVMDVLDREGSDEALALVARVAEGRVAMPLRDVGARLLDDVARQRGISRSELLDRLAPTFGARPGSPIAFDLGARSFRLVLSDELVPLLAGDDGRRYKQLPRPAKGDDAAKAADAAERWRWISNEAKVAARLQTRRLERAMLERHRWSAEAFDHLLQHPFLGILARRLVWREGTDGATFRVAEDGTPADDEDRAFTRSGADVMLPHPLETDPEVVGRWSGIFADYGIMQPFEQLGRAIFEMPASLLSVSRIDAANGRVVPLRRVVAVLDGAGWKNAQVTLRKTAGGTAYAYLAATPGVGVRKPTREGTQKLGILTLYQAASFAEIDPLDRSELLRALDQLR
jgi:hypothetical protein